MMLLFTVLFSRLSARRHRGALSALCAAGLLLDVLSNAISHGGHSLVGSAHIITKVYFRAS